MKWPEQKPVSGNGIRFTGCFWTAVTKKVPNACEKDRPGFHSPQMTSLLQQLDICATVNVICEEHMQNGQQLPSINNISEQNK